MTDNNVTPLRMSEQDEADLELLANGEKPAYHTVLEVWREVLKPAADEATKKVHPAWASRITGQFPSIAFADMNVFRDRYYGKIIELADLLHDVIESDDECLNYETPEEDVEHNSHHYRELLFQWQARILLWEQQWDCTDGWAAVELGAISEVHKMFFSQTGITAFLDNIKFEYTERDQAEVQARLAAIKEGE